MVEEGHTMRLLLSLLARDLTALYVCEKTAVIDSRSLCAVDVLSSCAVMVTLYDSVPVYDTL